MRFLWLLCCLGVLGSCQCRRHVAIEQVIYFQDATGQVTEHLFELGFDQMQEWALHVKNFEEMHGYPVDGLKALVVEQLQQYAFPPGVIANLEPNKENASVEAAENPPIYCHSAVKTLFQTQLREKLKSDRNSANGDDNNSNRDDDNMDSCSCLPNKAAKKSSSALSQHSFFFASEKVAHQHVYTIANCQWLCHLNQLDAANATSVCDSANSAAINASVSSTCSTALPVSILPPYLRARQHFLIYQSLGADTGGTIALSLLRRQLVQLGYHVTLCDNPATDPLQCTVPSDADIVITGEWCKGVLEEHGGGPVRFKGRGIQYHLGFHHFSDLCPGHVTVTDSHWLKALLSSRIMSGYFLGCPMVDSIRQVFSQLLFLNTTTTSSPADVFSVHMHEKQSEDNENCENSASENKPANDADNQNNSDSAEWSYLANIPKENLILLDMDILHDYPPRSQDIEIQIPRGYQLLKLQGIPRHRMASVLLRAKIILDLAMPGPERLAGEGILLGVIPIISKQWNGGSEIDFPGIRKVDSLNNTEISAVLLEVANNYPQELQSLGNTYFQGYISSLWQRLHNTADVYIGSSMLHFVVTARTLEEEVLVMFQVIGLLYLFPLASIDIYVRDSMWFTRQHYLFLTMMHESGYIHYDRYDPATTYFAHSSGHPSYVRIKVLQELQEVVNIALAETPSNSDASRRKSQTLRDSSMLCSWGEGLLIFLPHKITPPSSLSLYHTVRENIRFPDDASDNYSSSAAVSDVDASHVLSVCNPSTASLHVASSCCGAIFTPEVSVKHFAQIYTACTTTADRTKNSNTNTSIKTKANTTSNWRSIASLLMREYTSEVEATATATTVFVDSVVHSVPWQRILKMIKETSGVEGILGRG